MLVALRDFEKDKGDIVVKYSADEARVLHKENGLAESGTVHSDDEPCAFDFENI